MWSRPGRGQEGEGEAWPPGGATLVTRLRGAGGGREVDPPQLRPRGRPSSREGRLPGSWRTWASGDRGSPGRGLMQLRGGSHAGPWLRASVSPSASGGEEQRRCERPRDSWAAGSPAATWGPAPVPGPGPQLPRRRPAGNVSRQPPSSGRSRRPSRSESPRNRIIAAVMPSPLTGHGHVPGDMQPSACRAPCTFPPPPPPPEGPPAAAGSLGHQVGGLTPPLQRGGDLHTG